MSKTPLINTRKVKVKNAAVDHERTSISSYAQQEPPNIKEDGLGAYYQRSTWDAYNDTATIFDVEMLKEWEDNLTVMLVFAALFSAILTAFILETIKKLEQDDEESIRSILLTMSMQLRNASLPAYEETDYQVPNWAIRVNCFFFGSLGCNIFAALAAVLALQWIRDYNIGLTGVAVARERALRRHFRFEGANQWFMPEIISLLPTLLHVAMLLFVGGMVDWLVQMNLVVASMMIITLGASALFYVLTISSASIYPSAPFRTPMSRLIESAAKRAKSVTLNIYKSIFPERSNQNGNGSNTKINVSSTRYLRELQVVRSNKPLSSSALLWLLAHTDQSLESMPMVLNILRAFIKQESSSTAEQTSFWGLVQWAELLGGIFEELDKHQEKSGHFPKGIEKDFLTVFEIAAIVGHGALEHSSWLSIASTFNDLIYSTSTHGFASRFAGWRNGKPFPADSSNPPFDLFRGLCQQHGKVSDVLLVVAMKDLRGLVRNRTMDTHLTLQCINHLLSSYHHELGIANVFINEKLGSEILLTVYTALNGGSSLRYQRIREQEIEDIMEAILDMYEERRSTELPWVAELDECIQLLTIQILLGLSDSRNHDTRYLMQSVKNLRHPSLRHLWTSEDEFEMPLKLQKIVFDFFWAVPAGLYAWRKVRMNGWPIELVQAVKCRIEILGGPLAPKSDELYLVTSMLAAIGACVAGDSTDGIHARDLDFDEPVPWVVQLMSAIQRLADDRTFSSCITSMFYGRIGYIYSRALFCAPTPERVQMVETLQHPLLRILSCRLFGWEYAKYLPDQYNPLWLTPAFKILGHHLEVWEPFMMLDSDKTLLLRAGQQEDTFWNSYIFDHLSARSRKHVFTSNADDSPHKVALHEVLELGMPTLMDMGGQRHEAFHFLEDLAGVDNFLSEFIRHGGLELLASRSWPLRSTEDCARCHSIRNPFSAFLHLYSNRVPFHTLEKDQLETVLRWVHSLDIGHTSGERANVVSTIRTIYQYLAEVVGDGDVYPEAASQCAAILHHELLTEAVQPGYWVRHGGYAYNTQDFDEWCHELRSLIVELRGTKPL